MESYLQWEYHVRDTVHVKHEFVISFIRKSQNSIVGIVTKLRVGQSAVRFLAGARDISPNVETDPGTL
jgi:hypothetical protein